MNFAAKRLLDVAITHSLFEHRQTRITPHELMRHRGVQTLPLRTRLRNHSDSLTPDSHKAIMNPSTFATEETIRIDVTNRNHVDEPLVPGEVPSESSRKLKKIHRYEHPGKPLLFPSGTYRFPDQVIEAVHTHDGSVIAPIDWKGEGAVFEIVAEKQKHFEIHSSGDVHLEGIIFDGQDEPHQLLRVLNPTGPYAFLASSIQANDEFELIDTVDPPSDTDFAYLRGDHPDYPELSEELNDDGLVYPAPCQCISADQEDAAGNTVVIRDCQFRNIKLETNSGGHYLYGLRIEGVFDRVHVVDCKFLNLIYHTKGDGNKGAVGLNLHINGVAVVEHCHFEDIYSLKSGVQTNLNSDGLKIFTDLNCGLPPARVRIYCCCFRNMGRRAIKSQCFYTEVVENHIFRTHEGSVDIGLQFGGGLVQGNEIEHSHLASVLYGAIGVSVARGNTNRCIISDNHIRAVRRTIKAAFYLGSFATSDIDVNSRARGWRIEGNTVWAKCDSIIHIATFAVLYKDSGRLPLARRTYQYLYVKSNVCKQPAPLFFLITGKWVSYCPHRVRRHVGCHVIADYNEYRAGTWRFDEVTEEHFIKDHDTCKTAAKTVSRGDVDFATSIDWRSGNRRIP